MAEELFRFTTIRPARPAEDERGRIPLDPGGGAGAGTLSGRLAAAPGLAERRQLARDHLESDEVVRDLGALAPELARLDSWVRSTRDAPSPGAASRTIERQFGSPAAELASSDSFRAWTQRLADDVAAFTVPGAAPAGAGAGVATRGLRLLHLVRLLASRPGPDDAALAAALRAPIVVPRELVAAPDEKRASKKGTGDAPEPPRGKKRPAGDGDPAARVTALETAVAELRHLWHRARAVALGDDRPGAGEDLPGSSPAPADPEAVAASVTVLTPDQVSELSAATRGVLRELGVSDEGLDVPQTVTRLEREVAVAAAALPGATVTRPVVPMGSTHVAASIRYMPPPPPPVAEGPPVEPLPEPVPPPVIVGPGATVPQGARSLLPAGVADLLLVRQTLRGYEAGEVAHIENALRGESKSRTHRRRETTERLLESEEETTETTERDLQSTSRFEMQRETEETLRQQTQVEAGVTVSASYGPFVQVTADARFAHEQSREATTRSATSFAKDVTERAASRVQSRTFERRLTRTVQEVEEISEHGLDNSGGNAHLAGVYRWVDKVYDAQVVNYGQRLLYEFLVPEPAAFWRHAQAARPLEGVTLERPDPPTAIVGQQRVPLSPDHLTPGVYLQYVAAYGAEGVDPPPPQYQTVGTTLEREASQDKAFTKVSTEVTIPVGYAARSVRIAWTGREAQGWAFKVHVLAGAAELRSWWNERSAWLAGETGRLALAMGGIAQVAAVNVEVTCELTAEHYQSWQLATFEAIRIAYEARLAAYEEQLAAASVGDGIAISGRAPARNRAIEREELKRGVLTLATGQHFEMMDAVRPWPPQGYPELLPSEAEGEGRYVRFLEQAFEWPNMTYVLYPYFWGRKDEWPAVMQLDDVDPQFAEFLRAGAARVVVPVRPGFEETVLFYFESRGTLWNGADPPAIADPLYLAIVDEIRSQTGDSFVRGEGTISLVQGAADVAGQGTSFAEDDVDRELRVDGRTYRIREVVSATEVVIDPAWVPADAADRPYSLGPRLLGEPWEVRLPTTLVQLQADAALPTWPSG